MAKRWKPKEMDTFFHLMINQISGELRITYNYWHGYEWQEKYYEQGHCWKTERQAEKKLKQILKVLKER